MDIFGFKYAKNKYQDQYMLGGYLRTVGSRYLARLERKMPYLYAIHPKTSRAFALMWFGGFLSCMDIKTKLSYHEENLCDIFSDNLYKMYRRKDRPDMRTISLISKHLTLFCKHQSKEYIYGRYKRSYHKG